MAFNIGIYIIIQILLNGAYYQNANTEGLTLPAEFWKSVYENEKGEQGNLRVSEDGTAIVIQKFETIHDEMHNKRTDPNVLVESTKTPVINTRESSTPLLPTLDEAPLFPDILKTYGAIAADRTIETKVQLAKTCIGWVIHKMPPNIWPTPGTLRENYISMQFLDQFIDNIPKTVSPAQAQGVYLFHAAIVAYSVASAKNLTQSPAALYNAFTATLERNVNLDALGYV